MAILDGSGRSLLMRWVAAVVAEYRRYVTWPVESLKLDDLFATYQAREARTACQLDYSLEVDAAGGVAGVTVASRAAAGGGGCAAPLLTAAGATTVEVPPGGSTTVTPAGLSWK
jgi:hypothetical protein